MNVKVSADNRFLIVTDGTQLELDQVRHSFTKKVDNWWIIKKKMEEKGKNPHNWGGEVEFMDVYNRIPIGLWHQLINVGKQYKFPISIEGTDQFTDADFDEDDFYKWVEDYFDGAKAPNGADFMPYPYQVEAAARAMKYRFCTEEISMSGGKTLISFLIFRYLLASGRIKKMLYVVPSMDLVTQSLDEYLEYEDFCGNEPEWKYQMVFSKARKTKGEPNITFGTYQSLTKKPLEFFKDYDAVFIDETHHGKSSSIKSIIAKCYNSKYRIGMTGTLPPPDSCDFFTIQAYLGPKVYVIHSHELIDAKKATPINVICIEMDYLEDSVKKNLYDLRMDKNKDGAKLLALEKSVARDNRKRFNYIVNKIAGVTKNSLVLFADIKYGYGKKIYDWLRSNTDQNVYYIDGSTDKDTREYYKDILEKEENIILVASTGTFSEGISVKNIHNIFITESNKSEQIIRQILGRGMRLLGGKESVLVIDFSDNFVYGTDKFRRKNYLIKHSEEREKIYRERKFPFKKFNEKF